MQMLTQQKINIESGRPGMNKVWRIFVLTVVFLLGSCGTMDLPATDHFNANYPALVNGSTSRLNLEVDIVATSRGTSDVTRKIGLNPGERLWSKSGERFKRIRVLDTDQVLVKGFSEEKLDQERQNVGNPANEYWTVTDTGIELIGK